MSLASRSRLSEISIKPSGSAHSDALCQNVISMLKTITWPFSSLICETISWLNDISCITLRASIVNELKKIIAPVMICLTASNDIPAMTKINNAA